MSFTFPVKSDSTIPGAPSTVSSDVLEAFRAQIETNHGATLETLAARGGLTAWELRCACRGQPPVRFIVTEQCGTWLSGL